MRTAAASCSPTPADLAALTAAVQPIYAVLERDAQTQTLIERIRALEGGLRAGPARSRGMRSPAPAAGAQGDEGPRVLDGVCRVETQHEQEIEAGLRPDVAAQELGVTTIRLASGRYDWRPRARDGEQRCPGSYEVAGDPVVFTDEGECSRRGGAFEGAGPTVRLSRVGPRRRTIRRTGRCATGCGASPGAGRRGSLRRRRLPGGRLPRRCREDDLVEPGGGGGGWGGGGGGVRGGWGAVRFSDSLDAVIAESERP